MRQTNVPSSANAPVSAPARCWPRVWYLLKTSWAELVQLNLLTLLCCVPVLTIPAALLAQQRILICLCGSDGCRLARDYFAEFCRSLRAGFALDLLLLPMAVMMYVLAGYSSYFSQNATGLVILALMVFAVFWSWAVYSYAFVMRAAMDLTWMDVLRNALLLSVMEIRNDVSLLLPLLLFGAGLFFLPYTCVLFLLCLLSVCGMLTSCMVFPVLQRRLVKEAP